VTVHGSRVGAGITTAEVDRGYEEPRRWVSFWCAGGHETRPGFAADADIPETWECTRCGNPAGPDKLNPPSRRGPEPHKTHLAYVKERRTAADGEVILAEALQRLQRLRGTVGAAVEPGHSAWQPPRPARRRAAARTGRDRPALVRPGHPQEAGGSQAADRQVRGGAPATRGDRPARPRRKPAARPAAAGPPPAPGLSAAPSAAAGSRPTGPAAATPPAAKRCPTCTYLLDSIGHKRSCLEE